MPMVNPLAAEPVGPALDQGRLCRQIRHAGHHVIGADAERAGRAHQRQPAHRAIVGRCVIDACNGDALQGREQPLHRRRRQQCHVVAAPGEHRRKARELDHVAEPLLAQQQEPLRRRRVGGPARIGQRLERRILQVGAGLVMRKSRLPFALDQADQRQPMLGLGQLRLRLERSLVIGLGVVEPRLLERDIGAVGQRLGESRIELERVLDAGPRLVQPAERLEDQAAVRMRRRMLGIELDHPVVVAQRLRQAAEPAQHVGAVEIGRRHAPASARSRGEARQRLVEPAEVGQRAGAVAVVLRRCSAAAPVRGRSRRRPRLRAPSRTTAWRGCRRRRQTTDRPRWRGRSFAAPRRPRSSEAAPGP